MNKLVPWLSVLVFGLASSAVFLQESHAQAISVVTAYKTEKSPHPNMQVDPSQIVLVVQVGGFSDIEWDKLKMRDVYVLADSTKAGLIGQGVVQSVTSKEGKTATTPSRDLFFIVPKAASTFELQVPSRPRLKFQVPAAIRR